MNREQAIAFINEHRVALGNAYVTEDVWVNGGRWLPESEATLLVRICENCEAKPGKHHHEALGFCCEPCYDEIDAVQLDAPEDFHSDG